VSPKPQLLHSVFRSLLKHKRSGNLIIHSDPSKSVVPYAALCEELEYTVAEKV